MLGPVIDGAKSGGSSKRVKAGQREEEHYETGIEELPFTQNINTSGLALGTYVCRLL